jgi:FMN reductase
VRLLAVVAAVTPPGRLHAAVESAVSFAREELHVEATQLNLADYRISFADGRPLERFTDDTASVVRLLEEADAILLASPVYRASFTGALKNLLDLTPVDALRGKPIGIVAMGTRSHHYLGVDWHLRTVLAWFGALVVPTGVYLESSHFQNGRLVGAGARSDLTELTAALIALAAVPRDRLGPLPLASRSA